MVFNRFGRCIGLEAAAVLLAVLLTLAGAMALSGEAAYAGTAKSKSFPASYTKKLNALKAKHPRWEFVPVQTGLDWKKASAAMLHNPAVNTVWHSFGDEYRSTEEGCYDYLNKVYFPKDGVNFYAASPKAVNCYMDPRNWLREDTIWMFEDQKYHADYQTLKVVKSIFRGRNNGLYKNADVFMKAARKYDISAIYLAVKAMEEQGSKINAGTIGGKRVYNVFNIGASDSKDSGKHNALIYARYGSTYKRPWTSVRKSIMGGAKYLSKNYAEKNQNSHYLEHFNVLNGLDKVGTHVYMTAVYVPRSNAQMTFANYQKYGIDTQKIVFRIPVFKNMPEDTCPVPSNKAARNNDFYLKALTIWQGEDSIRLIKRTKACYKTVFSEKVEHRQARITIKAVASDENTVVTGAGEKELKVGKNTFRIKVKASSGATRIYTVKIIRA